MLIDMCLHKFEIYQGAVAPNSFKSRTNSSCPDFFQKREILSNGRFEIYLALRNIVSTGQSARV